jgi:hypothetical protein
MSNTALVGGGRLIRILFRALYLEAAGLKKIKPIVYMGHLEDYYADRPASVKGAFHWSDLIPRGGQGFQIRRAFFENEPGRVAILARGVIQTLCTAPGVRFLTVSQAVDELRKLA